MPDREGEQGSGAGLRQHVHRDPRPGQHPGRLVGELRRPVPRVAADHDADRVLSAARDAAARPVPASPGPFPAAAAVPAAAAESRSQPATAAVVALTTARFIRFGPAATTPRSPAVPNSSRPANRSRNSASACAAESPVAPRPASAAGVGPVEQRLQLGPVPRVGIIRDPGPDRRPKLSLTDHLHHPSAVTPEARTTDRSA